MSSFDSKQFDPKITLGDLFIGLVTVFLAWVVSVLIEKAKSRSSALGGLFLQRIEEIRSLFRDTHSLSHRQAGNVWSKELDASILVNLRSISLLLTDLQDLSNKVYGIDIIAPIKDHYFKYKRLLTDTGLTNPLTLDRMTDAESVYRDIRTELTATIVQVCRL